MSLIEWIGIGVFCIILGFNIRSYIKLKHRKGEITSLLYVLTRIIYPIESKRGLILNSLNKKRSILNLTPLVADDMFTMLAQERCDEIDVSNELSHEEVWDEFSLLHSLGITRAGENIAYGYGSPLGVVNAWMKSESHFLNMMNPKWDFCGIGVKKDEKNRFIYCILFGYTGNPSYIEV